VLTWEKAGITTADRFDYLCIEGELKDLAPKIKDLASKTSHLHAVLNKYYGDKAVANARQIRSMLD
jgi:uncharacterized protein YecE (DUF72 family)